MPVLVERRPAQAGVGGGQMHHIELPGAVRGGPYVGFPVREAQLIYLGHGLNSPEMAVNIGGEIVAVRNRRVIDRDCAVGSRLKLPML